MTTGSLPHIILFFASAAFLALSGFTVSRMPRRLQNLMFVLAALLCSGGIFFRYAMNCSLSGGIDLGKLLIQMMQVCNFNFILLPLMLVPKFELTRQYSVFFSMFAAATVLFSLPSSFASCEWYDVTVLNFLSNHLFAIALPLWMICAKRVYPNRKYIPLVSICVILYFTGVYFLTEGLMAANILPEGSSYSYVHDPKGMPVITTLYSLIGLPFVHLLPLIPVLVAFFYLWAFLFRKASARKGR